MDYYPLMERFENYIVTLPNQPPIANFTYSPEEPVANQSVTFDASSSYDPDGNITAYEWDFGDGSTGSGVTVNHSYSQPGTYTVTLTVTDNDGLNDSYSANITVSVSPTPAPTLEWSKIWGSKAFLSGVIYDDAIYVVGQDNGYCPPCGEIYVAKLDESGSVIWQKYWDGLSNHWDAGVDIVKVNDSIYVIGDTTARGGDSYFQKYDASTGALIFTKYWSNGGNQDYWRGIATDGTYLYLAGWTNTYGNGGYDAVLFKYDANGNKIWDLNFGGSADDKAWDVLVDGEFIYIAGDTASSFGSGGKDAFVAKYDKNGSLIWNVTWGGSKDETAFSLTTDGQHLYVTGITYSYGVNGDGFLLKLAKDGALIWNVTFGGAEKDFGKTITYNHGIYVGVQSNSTSSTGFDVYLMAFDENGNQLWNISWGDANDDYVGLHGLEVVRKNNSVSIYVAGGYNYPDRQHFLLKYTYMLPNQPPVANFTYSPERPIANQTITFDASSSYDPDGTIVSYEWDFGDGNITNTTHEIIKHSYSESGIYEVTLTVTDDEGAKNSTSKEVSVQPADKTPPIITFVPPTPANNSILNTNWVLINITLNENGTAILNWNGVNETMLGCGKNFYKNVTDLSDGTYTYKVYANDTSNNWNVSETRVVVIDTTPPASISNLTSIRGQTWINWTWTNPQDADFNYTMVYLNGIWRTNTSHPFYNATNLTPNTSYEIGTRTVDKAGNINQSWVNQTTKTRPYPAPNIISFAPQSPVYDNEGTTRTFNITVDQVVNVSWWINGTEVFNQTAVTESTYTNSSAAIGTWNVSVIVSNANGTAMQTWIWHVTSPCFIATAAYGTPLHEDIDVLRDFRDEYLMTNPIGREFVKIYYTVSPPIADVIRENEGLRTIVREGLVKPLVYILKELQNQNRVKP